MLQNSQPQCVCVCGGGVVASFQAKYEVNNYIVRSYRDVIVVTNTATRTNKA